MNAWHEAVSYTLPEVHWGNAWVVAFDTAGDKAHKRDLVAAREAIPVEARSLVVLLRCRDR
jgi:hypothetical protein